MGQPIHVVQDVLPNRRADGRLLDDHDEVPAGFETEQTRAWNDRGSKRGVVVQLQRVVCGRPAKP
jgi:hypothetical protein